MVLVAANIKSLLHKVDYAYTKHNNNIINPMQLGS